MMILLPLFYKENTNKKGEIVFEKYYAKKSHHEDFLWLVFLLSKMGFFSAYHGV